MNVLFTALISTAVVVAASAWPQLDRPYGMVAAYERYMQGMKSEEADEEAKEKYFPEVAERANNYGDSLITMYTLPVESLDVGQTIGVVFRNPNDGRVGLTLVTEDGDFFVRVAFRINFGGHQNTIIINSREDNRWGRNRILVENFPENGRVKRISLFVTIEEDGCDITTSDRYLGFFPYQGSLTYDKVKYILWGTQDESATTKSVLKQISINFPRVTSEE